MERINLENYERNTSTNFQNIKNFMFNLVFHHDHIILTFSYKMRERSGSVVECLTRDRGAAGSSLNGVTALWSLSKTHLSYLSTGSTQEDLSLFK